MKIRSLALALFIGLSGACVLGADWPTARGNAQRTGNIDAKPGPARAPKILWVHESTDQYIASASPGDKALFVPALGTLNSGVMAAISNETSADSAKRVLWSKSQPSI